MEAITLIDEKSRINFGVMVHSLVMRGKSLSDAIKITEFSFKRKESKATVRDLVTTAMYVYTEIMGSKSFFQDVDKAYEIARDFISKYPSDESWDHAGITWEERLYKFALSWTKPA